MWLACDEARWSSEAARLLTAEGVSVVAGPPCDIAVLDATPPPDGCAVQALVVVVPRLADAADVMRAYLWGADQVLEEPISAREVVARVRAIARRLQPTARRVVGPSKDHAVPQLTVDLAAGLAVVDGRKVELGPEEAVVLDGLVARHGGVVTRAELVARIPAGPHSVDAVVRSIRSKLEAVEGARRLTTVRGVGFRLLDIP